MKIKLLSSALTGLSVTLLVVQGLASAGPVTVPEWGTPPIPSGGTISIVLHRTMLNVAPESVGFTVDLSASTFDTPAPASATVYDRQFHELEYYWTFGDAGDFSAPVNLIAAHKSRNFSYGAICRHMFRAAGTYAVTLMVVEPSSGKVATAEATVTVDAPDTVFSTTRTICVNQTGDSDFTGAPTGAQTIQANTLTDGSAVDTLIQGVGANPCRVLFKKGWTGTVGWTHDDFPSARHLYFGSYGATGARPVLNAPSTGSIPEERAVFRLNDLGDDNNRKDLRIVGLNLRGHFDETVDAAASAANKQIAVGGVGSYNVLMHDVDAAGFGLAILTMGLGATYGRMFHLDDCIFTNTGGQYPIYIAKNAVNTWSVLTGIRFAKNPEALTDNDTKALMRDQHSNYCHVRGCDLFQTDDLQPCLKLMDDILARGPRFTVCTSTMESVGYEVLSIAHDTAFNFESKSSLVNGLIEGCVLVGGYRTERGIKINGGGVTIRNNLIIGTGQPYRGNQFRYFVRCENSPANAAIADYPTRVYNNTFAGLRSSANNGSVTPVDVSPTDGASRTAVGLTVANNVLHMPNLSVPQVDFAPLDDTVMWTARGAGYTDPATGITDATYATPASTVANYAPLTGSDALGAALSPPFSERTILGLVRPQYASMGAWEMP